MTSAQYELFYDNSLYPALVDTVPCDALDKYPTVFLCNCTKNAQGPTEKFTNS